MTLEQREKLIARIMEVFPFTREEAEIAADGTEMGLKEREEGKRIPLSQFRKELGL